MLCKSIFSDAFSVVSFPLEITEAQVGLECRLIITLFIPLSTRGPPTSLYKAPNSLVLAGSLSAFPLRKSRTNSEGPQIPTVFTPQLPLLSLL